MKTISDFTIYCTPSQTRKALNLGAPLEIGEGKRTVLCKYQNYNTYKRCVIPTAEQLIGWLLDNGITDIVISRKMNPHTFGFNIWYGMNGLIQEEKQYPTRKKATLAAIDAALEYLSRKQ